MKLEIVVSVYRNKNLKLHELIKSPDKKQKNSSNCIAVFLFDIVLSFA